ncbi:MAG: ABC transporter permease [Armatimonadetes bacterium]|nr:ABC transporter permease [Armatimonadota bacterium]
MMRRIAAIARAEWIHNLRDPRSLFVIVALPVLLLLVYGYGINFDLDHIPFAVHDLDGSDTSRDVINQFRQNRYFDLIEVIRDRARIQDLLDRGAVTFVMVIPPGMERELGAGRGAEVQVVLDGADVTRANVAVAYVEGALLDWSAEYSARFARAAGVSLSPAFTVHPTVLYNPGLESTKFIVPGLIAILLSILAGLLTSTCIVREREWGSFETLVTSPAQAPEILVGKMIPYVGIAFADVLLSIATGRLVFGVSPAGSIPLLLAASVLYLVASLSMGLLFSVIAPTQRLAILMATLATLLPAVLLSGFSFPIASMPKALQIASNLVPATHFLIVIRGIYLKAAPFAVLRRSLLILLVFTLAIVTLAAKRFRKQL